MKKPGVNVFKVGVNKKKCEHPKEMVIETVFGKKYCKQCERNIK